MRRTMPMAGWRASVAAWGLLGFAATLGRSEEVASPLRRVEIAPLDVALTFARMASSAGPRVVVVTQHGADSVSGVDLSRAVGVALTDPIAALDALGQDALREAVRSAPEGARVTVPLHDLTVPVDLGAHHVAAGTNYPEHAGEAQVQDGPFLFAKLVEPTGPLAPVAAADALLDYEVELAWVTIDPIRSGGPVGRMGVLLCNDYTDRATLLRLVDPWDPTSGKGFTTGKSAPGYLPVGTLFVVPRDVRGFSAGIELSLAVNGARRQFAPAKDMIWDLDAMIAQAWARRTVRWDHRGTPVALTPTPDAIPPRTLLMSGTPGGTVFAGVPSGIKARGLVRWVLAGFRGPMVASVVETYIDAARTARRYLQPGDRVTIHADALGIIDNHIVP